jgi:hypothetical protein
MVRSDGKVEWVDGVEDGVWWGMVYSREVRVGGNMECSNHDARRSLQLTESRVRWKSAMFTWVVADSDSGATAATAAAFLAMSKQCTRGGTRSSGCGDGVVTMGRL